MNRATKTCFRRLFRDRNGSVALMVVIQITALMGFAAISVDAGQLYLAWNQLQSSSDAAALAGAKDIGVGGTPITTATAYSSVNGSLPNKNNITGVTTVMVAGYPALQCFKAGPACSSNQTPPTSANGIQVRQTATVPLLFARILGFSSINITASAAALAAGQSPPLLNVMFIVDATSSMGNIDATCGATRINCAVQGFETLLGELWPCQQNLTSCGTVTGHNVANPVDEGALLQFPGVQTAPIGGGCSSLPTVAYAGIQGTTNATTAPSGTTLSFAATPAFNTGTLALVTDESHPLYIRSGTDIKSTTSKSAIMSTTPTATDTIAKGDSIGVWPPIYQIIPLSSDYRTSDTATTLNPNSDLVACLQSLTAPGGFGTFYADAITIAQQTLAANARSNARNVIILLSDGAANAVSSTGSVNMVSQGPNWQTTTTRNECQAAVTAARSAAGDGTWVYTVSYGTPSSGGCTTDTGSYANACYVMSQIANVPGTTAGTFVNDPTKFYADDADGCQSTSHPSITALKAVFQNIMYSLTTPRLLPSACLANPPPGWC
jgi:Flp pilus assembly protein TadG